MACRTPFFPFAGLCLFGVLMLSCASPSSPVSRAQDVPDLGNDMIDRVTLSEEALHSLCRLIHWRSSHGLDRIFCGNK